MTRLPDWRARLYAHVQTAAARPYRPGEMDCALFAAGAIEAMTGTNPAAAWAGAYETLDDGLALLDEAGHADHLALLASVAAPVAGPAWAQVGDIAVMEGTEGHAALGVVMGDWIAAIRADGRGLGHVALTEAREVWRV